MNNTQATGYVYQGRSKPTRRTAPGGAAGIAGGGADFAHISRVHPHPANIRDELTGITELADSIRRHGILQPIVVQPHPQQPGAYIVLAGHRRLEVVPDG